MAGNCRFRGEIPPEVRESSSAAAAAIARNKYYGVEYSRFFNYPNIHPPPSQLLRDISKSRKLRLGGGTWLSPSPASLHLLTDDDEESPVLVISLRETICEEHCIPRLSFSWPQISRVSECPTRGCRVVFARYKDRYGQMQKFAMRFASSPACQTFIDTVKECLRSKQLRQCLSRSEEPFETQNFTSNEFLQSADPGLGLVNEIGNFTFPMPSSSNYQGNQSPFPEVTALPDLLEDTYEALPPSFTSLISECYAEDDQELVHAQETPRVEELQADLPSQTTRHTTTRSFCDLMGMLEKVITEMGGDLALC